MMIMSEIHALRMISAYIAENKLNSALEVEANVAAEATDGQVLEDYVMAIEPRPPDKAVEDKEAVDMQCLNCIYDEEPLGFEKDPMEPEKMQPQDPLEEVDLGELALRQKQE